MAFLTTITPYWQRPEMLEIWIRAIAGATLPGVSHLVYFVGEPPPKWWPGFGPRVDILTAHCPEAPGSSIGHYHNLGVDVADDSEWIMKLDIDTLPHASFFENLLPVLRDAKPREWFNAGMLYVGKAASDAYLTRPQMPVTEETYLQIMATRQISCTGSYKMPEATNFICRREDYLAMGGCDERFRGWGWEDYQQIYFLERRQRNGDPLPGPVSCANVTRRCRDEISRPKAKALWDRNYFLALLHRWHPRSNDVKYRDTRQVERNRRILFDRIEKAKRGPVTGGI